MNIEYLSVFLIYNRRHLSLQSAIIPVKEDASLSVLFKGCAFADTSYYLFILCIYS